VFQLPPLVPRTGDGESSSSPTLRATETDSGCYQRDRGQLAAAIKLIESTPTLTASQVDKGLRKTATKAENGGHQVNLVDVTAHLSERGGGVLNPRGLVRSAIAGFGNAVVPDLAEWLGRCLIRHRQLINQQPTNEGTSAMARVVSVTPSGLLIPTILIDTREQLPYTFENFHADATDGGLPLVVTTKRTTLRSGDYSVEGLPGVVIERKSLADLYGTLGSGRDRFERELQRLQDEATFPMVVVETSLEDCVTSPPEHSQMSTKSIFRSMITFRFRYPKIHWTFAGPRRLAEAWTLRVLERAWKEAQASGAEGKKVAA
jgi:DNA excision repair protein ERCC-4